MADTEHLKIPLIVGVSGHIDITTDEKILAGYIADFFAQLRDAVGCNTPVVMLTSIAAGADHLAVKYRPADVPYCVVMPFDEKEYAKDFSGQALEDYRADLAGAFKCIECNGQVKDYGKAADFIRTRSDVILTLWNGMTTTDAAGKPLHGGTYYQIRKAFELDKLLTVEPEKSHLVVNLPVTRRKAAGDSERSILQGSQWGTLEWQSEEQMFRMVPGVAVSEKNPFAQNLHNIRRYNDHLPGSSGKRNYLYELFEKNFPRQFKVVEKEFDRYDYLDRIAVVNQKFHKLEFVLIALLSVLAGVCGQLWGDLPQLKSEQLQETAENSLIFLYLFLSAGVFLYYWITRKYLHYKMYVGPRVIAEMVRCKLFWKLSGIKDDFFSSMLKNCDQYWDFLPLCNWEIADPPLSPEEKSVIENEIKDGFPAVKKLWIEDQMEFYAGYVLADTQHVIRVQAGENIPPLFKGGIKSIQKYFRPYYRINGYVNFLKRTFFWSGFALAAILLICRWYPGLNHIIKDYWLYICREAIIGLCPFLVATLGWILEKKRWYAIGQRYQELYGYFCTAKKKFSEVADPAVKQQLIKELMILCHEENSGWKGIKKDSMPEPMF